MSAPPQRVNAPPVALYTLDANGIPQPYQPGVTPAALVSVLATIVISTALSGAVALGGNGLYQIIMPSIWTAANLTFQVSFDAVDAHFQDMYDANGNEYTVTVTATPGRTIILPPADFIGINYIKVRSGTGAAPVLQQQQAILSLVTRPFA